MDSSRGGPLSTLILMLPLIAVPALVVLRPPERDSGFSSDDLSAADGADQFLSDADDFDSVFGSEIHAHGTNPADSSHDHHSASTDLLDAPLTNEAPGDTKRTRTTPVFSPDTPPIPPREPMEPQAPDLSRWGVTKTLWFSPGDTGAIGFAAFVPASNGRVRYRFSAIGESKDQVLRDVIRQIKEWKSLKESSRDDRAN